MKRALLLLAGLWLGVSAAPSAGAAQSGAALLTQGVRAYDDLEFDQAAGLLRRALAVQSGEALAPPDVKRALIYLAATELLREHRDSAVATSRRLVLLDPRFRPDELIFPPQVLTLYEAVRRATPVVTGRAPPDTTIHAGSEELAMRLYASAFHDITAKLVGEDGRAVRTLYTGPIADSLVLRWNGLDSTGTRAPPPGRYAIAVSSFDRQGRLARIFRVPLELVQVFGRIDTLPHPAPPADSLLWSERQPMGPALRALAPGALAGVAIALLPSVVASGEDASGARFVVGGTVTIAGIAAALSRHPGRAIPANVAHNDTLRAAWRRDVDDVARRNAARAREAMLGIRAGAPVVLTPEGP
ncbi:MAG TPA: hypothetical protein VGJ83_05100 [Gemmatimonadales bacterium]|jgi:hypothetical protein